MGALGWCKDWRVDLGGMGSIIGVHCTKFPNNLEKYYAGERKLLPVSSPAMALLSLSCV